MKRKRTDKKKNQKEKKNNRCVSEQDEAERKRVWSQIHQM